MSTALTPLSGTINANKSARPGYTPLLLCTITLIDGTLIYLSTSLNNSSLLSLDYSGNHYLTRITQQSISAIQARTQTGIDLIPTASISISDADRFLYTNYQLPTAVGFKGGIIQLTLVYWQVGTSNFTSDSSLRFTGILQKPYWEDDLLTLSAYSVKNPQNVSLPIDRVTALCQNIFPPDQPSRAAGSPDSAEDSWYWRCGYSPDISGGKGNYQSGTTPYTTCALTKSDCQLRGMYSKDSSNRTTSRFSGSQWNPPFTFSSVSYVSGQVVKGYNISNPARFNQRYPLGWGTGWVTPILMNQINDGNSQRGEFVVCSGNVGYFNIIQLNANGELIPQDTATGVSDVLFCFRQVTTGDRQGKVNTDAGYTDPAGNPQGDPYGGLCMAEYVLPSALVSSQSTPTLRALVNFPGVRYYTTPTSYTIVQKDPLRPLTPHTLYTQDGGINPAWAIMDMLVQTNYTYADLDIQSFINAAAVCDVQINHTDITGNTYLHCRYSFSLVLPGTDNARDLGSILQNTLRSFNASLAPNPTTGLIQLYIRLTLADQQPSPISGSNDNTARTSVTGAGTTANGYVAWNFNDSNILFTGEPPNLKPSIKQLPPLGSEVATTVAIPFQDAENQWVDDSYTVVDTLALPFTAQQQIQSNNFQIEGATTFDQIGRVVRTYFYEQTRGNFSSDPRGTLVYQLTSTHETNHLVVGNIVSLTHTRDGISNQLFRISKVSPTSDYRTVVYELTFHSDQWYEDNNTNLIPPPYSNPLLGASSATPLPWRPAGQHAYQYSPYLPYRMSWASFDFSLTYSAPDNNGLVNPSISLYGIPPVNVFAPGLQPPLVPIFASTSSTGGSIPPGNYTLYICTLDCTDPSNPKYSAPSSPILVTVPAGTSTNTITISRIYYRSASVSLGYALFCGADQKTQFIQQIGTSGTSTTLTLTSLVYNGWGLPDQNFSTFRVQAKLALHLGIWALPVISYSSGVITFLTTGDSRAFPSNLYTGYIITRLNSGSDNSTPPSYEPIGSWFVTSNTSTTITITTDALSSTIMPGDVLVMRAKCSVYSSTTIGDPNFVNTVYPTGSDETGYEVWILYGTGAGQRRTILNNGGGSTGVYTVKKPFDTTPDSTSVFVICHVDWTYDQVTSPFTISTNPSTVSLISTVDLTNYLDQQLIIRITAEDSAGKAGLVSIAPVREFYVEGKSGGSSIPSIAPVTSLSSAISGYDQNGNVLISLTYTPPSDPNFQGVHVWAEEPDFSGTSNLSIGTGTIGSSSLPGTRIDLGQRPVGTLVSGSYTLTLPAQPPPASSATWRFYACSYGTIYEQPLVPANQTGSSPSTTLTVSSTPPAGIGEQYAPLVTNLVTSNTQTRPGQSGYEYRYTVTWTEPTPGNTSDPRTFGGITLIFVPVDDLITGQPPINLLPFSQFLAPSPNQQGSFTTSWMQIPADIDLYVIYAISQNLDGQSNTYSSGVTPETQYQTPVINRTAPGGTFLPDVTNFSVSAAWVTDYAGNTSLEVFPTFTPPPSGQMWAYGYFIAEIPAASGNFFNLGSPSIGDGTEAAIISSSAWPTTAAVTWNFWIDSVDANGNPKYPPTGPTFGTSPEVSVSIPTQQGATGSATEFAPLVTGASASIVYSVSTDGTEMYAFTASWTDPTGNLFQGVTPTAVFTGGTPIPLGNVAPGVGTYLSQSWAVNNGATGVIYLCSYDSSGRTNAIVPGITPGFSFTIAVQTSGSLNFARALPSTLGTGLAGGGGVNAHVANINNSHFDSTAKPVGVGSTNPTNFSNYPTGSYFWNTSTQTLLISNGSSWTAAINAATDIQPGSLSLTPFASNIRPIAIGASLPSLPNSSYPQGSYFFNTSTGGLSKSLGSSWQAAVYGSTDIVAGSITADRLVANSITAGQIAAGAIGATQIAAGSITATQIASNTITAAQISSNTITSGQIAANTITGSNIAANTITGSNLVSGTITAGQIAAGTITATQISSSYIYAGNIVASQITSGSFNGITLTLNSNGVTTSVTNNADPTSGHGIVVQNNSSLNRSLHTETAFKVYDSSNIGHISLDWDSGATPRLYLLDTYGNQSIIQPTKILIQGNQVLIGRQTGPGTPSAITTLSALVSWCTSLYNSLSSTGGGHGLIS